MSSTQLSQMPLLILPVQNLKKLQSPKPTTSILTKSFNDKTLNEFRKTAATIEKSPFDLVEGSNYLRSLCDRSEKGEHPAPMPLSVYNLRFDDFQCHEELEKAGVVDGFQNFAPGIPKRMEVHSARPNFPKDNANGPVCAPEAVHTLSAMAAEAVVLEDDDDEARGEPDPAPAPKTIKTSQPTGRGKEDFFSDPARKPKGKGKGKPPKKNVIKTAVKSAAKPLAKKRLKQRPKQRPRNLEPEMFRATMQMQQGKSQLQSHLPKVRQKQRVQQQRQSVQQQKQRVQQQRLRPRLSQRASPRLQPKAAHPR